MAREGHHILCLSSLSLSSTITTVIKDQLTTATAGEAIISRGETVVKYATFARTYTTVTSEHEIHDAFGKFLQTATMSA